jgi:hypothetical protein
MRPVDRIDRAGQRPRPTRPTRLSCGNRSSGRNRSGCRNRLSGRIRPGRPNASSFPRSPSAGDLRGCGHAPETSALVPPSPAQVPAALDSTESSTAPRSTAPLGWGPIDRVILGQATYWCLHALAAPSRPRSSRTAGPPVRCRGMALTHRTADDLGQLGTRREARPIPISS